MMNQIDHLGLLIGRGICNARCPGCAGKSLRYLAPNQEEEVNSLDISRAVHRSLVAGCRSISISSSGEPTLSPRAIQETLEIIRGEIFNLNQPPDPFRISPIKINLYSNGIRLANTDFCHKYLPEYYRLGLTHIYISAYHSDSNIQGSYIGADFPSFQDILSNIKKYQLSTRINLILLRQFIPGSEIFNRLCQDFLRLGADSISAWPLRGPDDQLSPLAPDSDTLIDLKNKAISGVQVYWPYPSYQDGRRVTLFYQGEPKSGGWC